MKCRLRGRMGGNMELQEIIALVKRTKTFVENRERANHIKVKGPADYVTQVDTDIQNFLARELGRLAPEIQFLGEEEGLHEMSGDTYWILDPIDGTTNLIHDYQHSVVSLALYEKGEITMGIVYDPFREDVYHAQKGKGSFLNGMPIHVSDTEALRETIIAVGTSPYDRELAELIGSSGAACCLMHNRKESLYRNLMEELKSELLETLAIARAGGISDEKIILDPGVGFGKTYEHNREVICKLKELKSLGFPRLLGASRKSVIGLTLDLPVTERLEGTLVTTVQAVMSGCAFVRVHDIRENKRAIQMAEAVRDGWKQVQAER